jgi:predicted lysophospholipase L1 biosynthesis ABC-type transport system permease subunit
MNTVSRLPLRIVVLVVITLLAMSLPDAFGFPLWVGLAAGFVIGLAAFFALGLGGNQPRSS